jgi:hypothetical protein
MAFTQQAQSAVIAVGTTPRDSFHLTLPNVAKGEDVKLQIPTNQVVRNTASVIGMQLIRSIQYELQEENSVKKYGQVDLQVLDSKMARKIYGNRGELDKLIRNVIIRDLPHHEELVTDTW